MTNIVVHTNICLIIFLNGVIIFTLEKDGVVNMQTYIKTLLEILKEIEEPPSIS